MIYGSVGNVIGFFIKKSLNGIKMEQINNFMSLKGNKKDIYNYGGEIRNIMGKNLLFAKG